MGFHKTKVTTDENFFCGLKKKNNNPKNIQSQGTF